MRGSRTAASVSAIAMAAALAACGGGDNGTSSSAGGTTRHGYHWRHEHRCVAIRRDGSELGRDPTVHQFHPGYLRPDGRYRR